MAALNTGEVDDRGGVGEEGIQFERAIDDAAKPDCGAGAVVGVVLAEGKQFGDAV